MKSLFFILLSITLLSACSPETVKKETIPIGDWRHHGGNHNSDKYSPLDQIDGSNFSELELAWRYRSPDLDLPEDLAYPTGDYRAVPLVVDGIMYVNSNHGLISALNSATGENYFNKKTLTRYYILCDPKIPWQQDRLRENPHNRDELFDMYIKKLTDYKLNYSVVSGRPQERLRQTLDRFKYKQ